MGSTSKAPRLEAGSLYVVGNGEVFNELGLGCQVLDITYPIAIPDLMYESIVQVASSCLHSLALTRQGQIYSWGCDEFGALGRVGTGEVPLLINHPSIRYIKFKKIACGNSISMAISTKGVLYTWGTFRSSQEIYGYLPNVHIQDHPRIIDNVAEVHFVDISAGTSHCLALDDKGHVYSWGTHEYNVLGRSPNTPSLLPTKLDLTNITSIACGSFHSLVVDRFGQVYSWGLNHMLQCGLVEKADNGHYIEAPDSIVLPTLLPYFKKSTIKDNMRFLEEEACKQSLQGGSEMDKKTKAFSVKRPDVVSVAAGQYHSIAVMDDDTLRVWGRCDSGQLGLMFYPNYTYPASFKSKKNDQVYAIGHPLSSLWQCSEKIKKVVCGSSHTMVISTSGKIWGFGQSAFHQLGIYQEEDIILPSPIESIMDKGRIIEAAAGDRHSLFVVAEDEVRHQIRLLD